MSPGICPDHVIRKLVYVGNVKALHTTHESPLYKETSIAKVVSQDE